MALPVFLIPFLTALASGTAAALWSFVKTVALKTWEVILNKYTERMMALMIFVATAPLFMKIMSEILVILAETTLEYVIIHEGINIETAETITLLNGPLGMMVHKFRLLDAAGMYLNAIFYRWVVDTTIESAKIVMKTATKG